MADLVTTPVRSFIGTVVAVSTPERMKETRAAVARLQERAAIRWLVVSLGDEREPAIRDEDGATLIERLTPRYLNNVVASRRLSSLPAAAWWRGSEGTDRSVLRGLAPLVDRIVLDSADPSDDWRIAVDLFDETAFGDLRWTRLTRWRNLLAQFFDVPAIRAAAGSLTQLEIEAPDRESAALYAAWLVARLPSGPGLKVSVLPGAGTHPLTAVRLSGGGCRLELRVTPNGTCVRTTAEGGGVPSARTVSLGDQSLAAQLERELRVRARDPRFEEALRLAARSI